MNELWLFYSLIHCETQYCETQLEKSMFNIAIKFLVYPKKNNIHNV